MDYLQDPADISNIPLSFYEKNKDQDTPIMNDKGELAHFRSIIATFLNYQYDSMKEYNKTKKDFLDLKESHLKLLKYTPEERLKKLYNAIIQNSIFLSEVVEDHLDLFQIKNKKLNIFEIPFSKRTKICILLKQIKREWSKEGEKEREQSFDPIKKALQKYLKINKKDNKIKNYNILVPGCGLGRLVYDIVSLGYNCKGIEFDYFMLQVSEYILNKNPLHLKKEIFPYIHNFTNRYNFQNSFQSIKIPDINNFEIPPNSQFAMISGEFVQLYKKGIINEKFNSVVTCFFIDTAHNVLEYLEVIYEILCKGGLWINNGPLMYHFKNVEGEISIELSLEEIFFAAEKMGFEFLEKREVECGYCENGEFMAQMRYKSQFFVARKI